MCIRDRYDVELPFERIALDVARPITVTYYGNRSVMVRSDYVTKCVEDYEIPKLEFTTVANAFVHNFCRRYGVPMDQGKNFH